MIPWLILAVVVVPLVIVAFVVTRRKTQLPGGASASETTESRARTEDEFAAAEAYEAKWHEEDKERFHRERLP